MAKGGHLGNPGHMVWYKSGGVSGVVANGGNFKTWFLIISGLLGVLALTACQLEEQNRGDSEPENWRAFTPRAAGIEDMDAKGLFETGLKPVYPKEVKCLEVTSSFGSGYRGDGSLRNPEFYQGRHGGMDIPATEGTPILAVASGTVIHKKVGGGLGGILIFLQHAPEDTGLPAWTYTEYKHLREMPDVVIGQRVEMGQVIARTGATGTVGRYYPMGHSHLHLTAFFGPRKDFIARRFFVPVEGEWLDPLALFKGPPLRSAVIRDFPDDQKMVQVPYKTTDGRFVPEGTKVVWPYAYEPR